jgi:prepilin peptidase CpaA
MTLYLALSAACAASLLLGALLDIATRTIPNFLASTVMVTGLAIAAFNGEMQYSILAAAAVFAFAVACWRLGWMGGGDVKLLGAASLALPPSAVPLFVAAVAIAGGVLAISYLLARKLVSVPGTRRPAGLLERVVRVEQWRIRRGRPLPYACAITAGFIFMIV